MKGAVILTNHEKVEVRDFPAPSPGHSQVVVKVMASGICGSDLRGDLSSRRRPRRSRGGISRRHLWSRARGHDHGGWAASSGSVRAIVSASTTSPAAGSAATVARALSFPVSSPVPRTASSATAAWASIFLLKKAVACRCPISCPLKMEP